MRLLRSIIMAAIAVAVGLVGMLTPAKAAECIAYQIQIDVLAESTLAPSVQNTVNQILVLRREGYRNNPYEIFFLFPGDPNSPNSQVTPGSLEVLTNSRFARNPGIAAAAIDLADTDTIQDPNGGLVNRFQLIPDNSFQQPQPNVLVVPGAGQHPGGLGGICSLPGLQSLCKDVGNTAVLQSASVVPRTGGDAFILSPDLNQIQGNYQLEGSSLDNSNLRGRHTGQFFGQAVQAFQC